MKRPSKHTSSAYTPAAIYSPALTQELLGTLHAPDEKECPALFAFLRGQVPDPRYFVNCLDWCLKHGVGHVVAAMQSQHPEFRQMVDLSILPSGVSAIEVVREITFHRIACGLCLELSNLEISQELADCLLNPQCALYQLVLLLPPWDSQCHGSLVARLGKSITRCLSLRTLRLMGSQTGPQTELPQDKCNLETSFIEEVLTNPRLRYFSVGAGIHWHGPMHLLDAQILRVLCDRDDGHEAEDGYPEWARAIANVIALNRETGWPIELGLYGSQPSPAAKKILNAHPSIRTRASDWLRYVQDTPADERHKFLLFGHYLENDSNSDSESAFDTKFEPGSLETRFYLLVSAPSLPPLTGNPSHEDDDDDALDFMRHFMGIAAMEKYDVENRAYWIKAALRICEDFQCIPFLRSVQIRYPDLFKLYVGNDYSDDFISLSKFESIRHYDFEYECSFYLKDKITSSVMNLLKNPGKLTCLELFNLGNASYEWIPFAQSIAQAGFISQISINPIPETHHTEFLSQFEINESSNYAINNYPVFLQEILASKSIKKISFTSTSAGGGQFELDPLESALEQAFCGQLTEFKIYSTAPIVETVARAVIRARDRCSLKTLSLHCVETGNYHFNLVELLRRTGITDLSLDIQFAHSVGASALEGAVLESESLGRLRLLTHRDDSSELNLISPRIVQHLRENRDVKRIAGAKAMYQRFADLWGRSNGHFTSIGAPLAARWRDLDAEAIGLLAETSRSVVVAGRTGAQASDLQRWVDELISANERVVDQELAWIVHRVPLAALPEETFNHMRRKLVRVARFTLDRGLSKLLLNTVIDAPVIEYPLAPVDSEIAQEVQRIVRAVKDAQSCEPIRLAMQGLRPPRALFDTCVNWCAEEGCMNAVVAIQRRWPEFSGYLTITPSDNELPILQTVFELGITCSHILVSLSEAEDHDELVTILLKKAPRPGTIGLLTLSLEGLGESNAVSVELATALAATPLRALALIANEYVVKLDAEFMPALLGKGLFEQLELQGSFAPQISSELARWCIERGTVRSLHVRSTAAQVEAFVRAIEMAGKNNWVTDLELSCLDGEPRAAWASRLLKPELHITSLALEPAQLRSMLPHQWRAIHGGNRILTQLRPVTSNPMDYELPAGASELLTRNRYLRTQALAWAAEAFMASWVGERPKLQNRAWFEELVGEGLGFDGLLGVNRRARLATGIAAHIATHHTNFDAIASVLHTATCDDHALGIRRIVDCVLNSSLSMTAQQFARLSTAVGETISRHLIASRRRT